MQVRFQWLRYWKLFRQVSKSIQACVYCEKYNTLYIYTDTIQKENVGEVKALLLRVVLIKSAYVDVSIN